MESRSAPRPGRIAYLTNQYPAPTHTFIRDEILNLEAQGWTVLRFAHRRGRSDLVDPLDLLELKRTSSLLGPPRWHLLRAPLYLLWRKPARLFSSLRLSLRLKQGARQGWLRHLAYWLQACRLANELETLGCQHIHVHFGTNPATVALLAGHMASLPASLVFHGPHEYADASGYSIAAKVEIAHLIFTVTRRHHQELCSLYPAWQEKFKYLPCGLDDFWLQPDAPGSLAGGDQRQADLLFCVARLDRQKNLQVLLQAVALVLPERPVRLEIAGDGPERSALEALCEKLNLGDAVTFLGWLTRSEVKARLEQSCALVLSSFDEGLPMAIKEAMACGTPVISTDAGGIGELVEHECTGWLSQVGDAAALATNILARLQCPPAEVQSRCREARRRLQSHQQRKTSRSLARALAEVLEQSALRTGIGTGTGPGEISSGFDDLSR